jgi:hypothetical protein
MTFCAKVDNFADSSSLPEHAEPEPICLWNTKCIATRVVVCFAKRNRYV